MRSTSGYFHLPYPPTTNTLFAHTGRTRYKTKAYQAWIEEAGYILKSHRLQPFKGPVWIDYQAHRPDNRRRDLSNIIKAPEDLLVSHEIIEEDSMVVGFSAKWVGEGNVIWLRIRHATPREAKDGGLTTEGF